MPSNDAEYQRAYRREQRLAELAENNGEVDETKGPDEPVLGRLGVKRGPDAPAGYRCDCRPGDRCIQHGIQMLTVAQREDILVGICKQ